MTEHLALVDPELREAALAMRATMAAYSPMNRRKLAARRRWIASIALEPLADVPYAHHVLPRTDGQGPDVGVYAVNARPGQRGGGLLHIHGGGFTASTALSGLRNVQQLAAELDCPVVSVDYRLAPETRWDGALADNLTALRWMQAQAPQFGVDPARIGLLGESAGGGHAAMLALAARDHGGPLPAFMALVYPMLDDRTGSSRHPPEPIGSFGWNAEANRFGWKSYLGRQPGTRGVPAEAVPARAPDLRGLPPTWIGVGGLDLFVEENLAFATRLLAAGVPVELLVVPGGFHGFDSFVPDAAISRRFTAAKLGALRRFLG